MTNRPKWVLSLQQFVSGELVDELPPEGEDDPIHDEIELAVNAVLCGHYGHEIIDDQCGIPDHRYCVWCNRRETAIAGDTP